MMSRAATYQQVSVIPILFSPGGSGASISDAIKIPGQKPDEIMQQDSVSKCSTLDSFYSGISRCYHTHTRTCAGALAHVRAHKQRIYDVLLARGRAHDSFASWRCLCNHEIARRRSSNATSMCICASAPAVWLLTRRWACRGKSTVTRSRKRMGMLLGLSPIPISWRTQ